MAQAPVNVKRPKCSKCGTGRDVQLAPRPGQIPGAAHAQRWICGSCLYLEDHPDAARVEPPSKPKVPQVEELPL
jgi:ribosomal protein S27AE